MKDVWRQGIVYMNKELKPKVLLFFLEYKMTDELKKTALVDDVSLQARW